MEPILFPCPDSSAENNTATEWGQGNVRSLHLQSRTRLQTRVHTAYHVTPIGGNGHAMHLLREI